MFGNKHVVVAMLVAPVLAVIAWFGVDYLVAERPHAAESGASYMLVARSNCRYDSGQCDLVNGDFELVLRAGEVDRNGIVLAIESRYSLQAATVGLVEPGAPHGPAKLVPASADTTRWSAPLPRPTDPRSSLRIAVVARGATYYAEVPVAFLALESWHRPSLEAPL